MNPILKRGIGALVLLFAAGAIGYNIGTSNATIATPSIPATTITAPPSHSIRVLYSLDQKQNDKEIIALVEGAKSRIYFAIYTFTLENVAEALARAKKRGVDVRGVVDSGQSGEGFSAPVMRILHEAGIPLVTERHANGNGIMHIKALVTDRAYAIGSYNWTKSATTANDEILEIGTDEALRKTYETLLQRLLETYAHNPAPSAEGAGRVLTGTYDFKDAPAHIGEYARVRGTLVEAYTSKTGTVFLDFCKSYKTCPFSGVIFADDAKKFADLQSYIGSPITLTGKITSYQGKAEIVISSPSQISK